MSSKALEVARQGDRDRPHCSGMVRAKGSPNVFTNGRPTQREGVDPNTKHLKFAGDKCVPHTAVIAKGSRTVFVNGIPIGRITDPLVSCTNVAQGSPNVYAGG